MTTIDTRIARPAAAALPWHAAPGSDALGTLQTTDAGLATAEAQRRLATHGPNVIAAAPPEPALRILVRQFRSVITALLGVAAIAAWMAGHAADAVAVGVVLALTVALGFVTELRARRAVESLHSLEIPTALAYRDGRVVSLPARDLVPGDVLRLEAGQSIAADARLLVAHDLRVVEAPLTGESVQVDKSAGATVDAGAPLPDRVTMVYRGTTVAGGSGRAVVVATGTATEVGRIGMLASATPDEPTIIERRLDALGRRLAVAAVTAGAALAVISFMRGSPLTAVVQMGIAVAVAAVPEGLPAVVTATMAIAAHRMARRRVRVRRIPAVEALGSVTVVCADKTGTLTTGDQVVASVWLPDDVHVPLAAGASLVSARHLLTVAALANRADAGGAGDPIEVALLAAARTAGIERAALLTKMPEVGELPFSSERMYMGSFHRDAAGDVSLFLKGAPHRVLDACSHVRSSGGPVPLDPSMLQLALQRSHELAADGLRVLALAAGPSPETVEPKGLEFVGLVAMRDPPAPRVADTIATLRGAGVRTIMITGDHRETARAIGRAVGITGDAVVTDANVADGGEVDAMDDPTLRERVARLAIISRASPEAKVRLVEALRARGEVVAMIGDGVNDAAALRRADIGVAMGRRGTDAAKDAAGIVLADDRFEGIGAAVEEGRVVFDNIRRFVFYLFSCNLAEILALFGGAAIGLPLPLTAMQILWLNLLTDTFPALALAAEPAASNTMRRPPRDPRASILSRGDVGATMVFAFLIAAVTLAALWWGSREWPHAPAQVVTLSFTTLAIGQVLHLGNARRWGHVLTPRRAVSNPWALGAVAFVLLLQAAALTVPFLTRTLGTAGLPARGWLVAIALGAVPAVIGQAWKLIAGAAGRRGQSSTIAS